jgi:hypothetical protein
MTISIGAILLSPNMGERSSAAFLLDNAAMNLPEDPMSRIDDAE